jgi:hypothetical protein
MFYACASANATLRCEEEIQCGVWYGEEASLVVPIGGVLGVSFSGSADRRALFRICMSFCGCTPFFAVCKWTIAGNKCAGELRCIGKEGPCVERFRLF